MEVSPYLSFDGRCEEAFRFYEECLGAKMGAIFRYAGTQLADTVPADWHDKVMHCSLTLNKTVLMGGDVSPKSYEQPKGISLSLNVASVAEAERVFSELGKDGTIDMPLQETFWAARFGVVRDRFGIPWLINCDGSE